LNILQHINCVDTLPRKIYMPEKLTIIDSKHGSEQNTLPTKNAVNDLHDATVCQICFFAYLAC